MILSTTSTPLQSLASKTTPTTQFTNDPILEAKLHALIDGFRGDIAIYVRHFGKYSEIGINHKATFPTASIIKIPILIGIHQKIMNGELDLHQMFTYHESQAYGGSGIMQYFKDKTQIDLKMLIFCMISFSDNVASIWNQELAGTGIEINKIMEKLGLDVTRVNSRTPGREDEWKKWGWGQTSAYEIATLITMIREGKVLTPEMSKSMYRFLGNHYYDERALSQIPPDIKSASKSGSLDESRSEVVFVNDYYGGEYVFSFLTNNNQDQSWDDHNEAEVLCRKVSKLLWDYYHTSSIHDGPKFFE